MLCVKTEINRNGELIRTYRTGAVERVKKAGLIYCIQFYLLQGPGNLLRDLKVDVEQFRQKGKRGKLDRRKF